MAKSIYVQAPHGPQLVKHPTPYHSEDTPRDVHLSRPTMGICKPGYTSIYSLFSDIPDDCNIDHSFSGEHQFWTFYFNLKPSFERQVDELALGRIKNVVSVLRLTREMYTA